MDDTRLGLPLVTQNENKQRETDNQRLGWDEEENHLICECQLHWRTLEKKHKKCKQYYMQLQQIYGQCEGRPEEARPEHQNSNWNKQQEIDGDNSYTTLSPAKLMDETKRRSIGWRWLYLAFVNRVASSIQCRTVSAALHNRCTPGQRWSITFMPTYLHCCCASCTASRC